MAKGRMLNQSVSDSKKYNSLPDDTCRLLATWTIAHLDKNGVFHAEPTLVRSKVFPWRDDIPIKKIAAYLDAMEEVGLIVRFEEGGHTWQVWPGFEHNQPGMHPERERTTYPEPPEVCGVLPEKRGENPAIASENPQVSGENPASCGLTELNPTITTTEGNGSSADVAAPVDPPVTEKPAKKAKTPKEPKQPPPEAIERYRSVVLRYPHSAVWRGVAEVVGHDPPELDFWERVVRAWIACGWNPQNVKGMLQFYLERKVPGSDNGHGRTAEPKSLGVLREYMEKAEAENGNGG